MNTKMNKWASPNAVWSEHPSAVVREERKGSPGAELGPWLPPWKLPAESLRTLSVASNRKPKSSWFICNRESIGFYNYKV